MTRYIGCETAHTLLDPFVDGELSVADQVMVESHLRWCDSCAARVEDMARIGMAVRAGAHALPPADDENRMFAALQDQVLTRFSAEQEESLAVRVREIFVDMRLLWPALGATAAVVVCLLGVFGVLHKTATERPESLAALIASMSQADPGSDANPLRLDNTVTLPRRLDDGPMLEGDEDEAVFAFAAVVTREGRIGTYELLRTERSSTRVLKPRRAHDEEIANLLHAIKTSRFQPAQVTLTGSPVAVNLVWLLARTTVKGSAQYDLFQSRPTALQLRNKRERPKPDVDVVPAEPEPVAVPASGVSPSPTA